MTDEELITALRMRAESELCQAAADRIHSLGLLHDMAEAKAEGLLREAKGAEKEIANLGENLDATFARAKRLEAALREIESITVHSGGEIHGVTADRWKLAFEQAQDEARAALTQKEPTDG